MGCVFSRCRKPAPVERPDNPDSPNTHSYISILGDQSERDYTSLNTNHNPLLRTKNEIRLPKQEEEDLPNYKVAVAFDFGTTFSGYAYSYKDKPNEILLNATWGQNVAISSWKSPTTVCLKKDGTFDSFGYEANANYLHGVTNGLQLYKKFKLQLHEQRENIYGTGLQITSDNGKIISGIEVFSAALRYMKEHFMKIVTDAKRINSTDEVLWVLTVPAIWSEEEKMFMKECAVKAGMIDNSSSNRLKIALEPEAASFDCRTGDGKMTTGQKYMIIDAGGGTVDITVHKIQNDGSSCEIHPPTGGTWGGDMVNKQFEELLSKVWGVDFQNHCKEVTPRVYFELMQEFETKKTGIKDFKQPMRLTLSMNLAECYKDKTGNNLTDALADTKSQGIWIPKSKSGILVEPEELKKCLDPTIEKIVSHVGGLLKKPEVSDVDKIFLVGGFGSCTHLQNTIKSKFSNNYIIHIPEEPTLSVVKGAVLFAHHPGYIASRISTKTYAFKAYRDIPKENVDTRRVVGKNAYSFLKPIIIKGESVKINTIKQQTAFPDEDYMISLEMELFSTTEEFDENPFGEGISRIAIVKVDIPRDKGDRTITFQFIFGGTDLRVRGTNSCGESVETMLSYIQS